MPHASGKPCLRSLHAAARQPNASHHAEGSPAAAAHSSQTASPERANSQRGKNSLATGLPPSLSLSPSRRLLLQAWTFASPAASSPQATRTGPLHPSRLALATSPQDHGLSLAAWPGLTPLCKMPGHAQTVGHSQPLRICPTSSVLAHPRPLSWFHSLLSVQNLPNAAPTS